MKKKITGFLFLCFLLGTLSAHEYIMIAHDFILKKGDLLELRLFVADGFNVEFERTLEKDMTKSFVLFSENGETNLLEEGADRDFPILQREIDFEGLGLICMERDYARITMLNEDFLDYLQHDNIEHISIDQETKTEQTERYSRYIKSLIQSDKKVQDDLYKKQVGHIFEIVFLNNPYEAKVGDELQIQVFFEGKPLTNKVMTARNRIGSLNPIVQYARTDLEGKCKFFLEREGDWVVHATHMIPCPDPSDSDWESFWTSFSFGLE